MTAFRLMIAAAGIAASLALPAGAQSVQLGGVVTGNDIQRVMDLAQAYGPVERRQDDDGTWLRAEFDGLIHTISFLNCNDQRVNCTSVQFRAWWETENRITLERVNQWNRDRRFSSAYLDSNNNASIEWDVTLAGGVTAVNFDDALQWWHTVMGQFRDEVIDPVLGVGSSSGGSGGAATK